MKLAASISIYAGGPGSGCNPEKGKCGRPKGSGGPLGERAISRMTGPEILKWHKEEMAKHAREQAVMAKPAKKMATALKLPGGTGMEFRNGDYKWSKGGGYFNKFSDIEEAAKKAGFTRKDARATGNPDGSYMGSSVVMEHPDGWELSWSRMYGVVKSDNSFRIELRRTREGTK